jgi:hypothetical protein
MIAPYQIALQDGRLIYAPQDIDQVIRKRPPPQPTDPPSPDYPYPQDDEDMDDDYDEADMELPDDAPTA